MLIIKLIGDFHRERTFDRFADLKAYIDRFWDDSLLLLKEAAEEEEERRQRNRESIESDQ
ncbi:hypothetical protein [Paenibacillus alginolyticus]|uniref:hypothetical protein n=1 Tax=Paenibacillus alginolyticus TaxID=59839 RepID=UPI0004000808|nr:hypothetical protein [Paenibacillus alginolyticus]MEC0141888.1 hypothetical protein [Paenibacillus alginolyticus]